MRLASGAGRLARSDKAFQRVTDGLDCSHSRRRCIPSAVVTRGLIAEVAASARCRNNATAKLSARKRVIRGSFDRPKPRWMPSNNEASGVSYRQRYGAFTGAGRQAGRFSLIHCQQLTGSPWLRKYGASAERRAGDERVGRLQVRLRGVFHIDRVDQVFAVADAAQLPCRWRS